MSRRSWWTSDDVHIVSMDKHGMAELYVWAESATGKSEARVRVTLTAEQVDLLASRLADIRARYPREVSS